MPLKSDIEKQRKRVELKQEIYQTHQTITSFLKNVFYVGLTSVAYLGIRALCGEDVTEFFRTEPASTIDTVATTLTITAPVTGLVALLHYAIELDWKKDSKKEEQRLRTMIEDYGFSRGHV